MATTADREHAAGRGRVNGNPFAAQNLYLEVAALGLGTTFAGSFQDSTMARLVGLPESQRPLGIMPVGHPR